MKNITKKLNRNNIFLPLIVLVIIIILANSILLYHSFHVLHQAEETKTKAESALSAFSSIWDQLKSSDLGIRSFLINQNEDMLTPHHGALVNYKGYFDQLQGILSEQGDVFLNELKRYQNAFEKKLAESDHIISLIQNNQKEEALEIYNQDSGSELFSNHFWPLQQKLVEFEQGIINKAEERYQTSLARIRLSQIILLGLSVPVLLMVISMLRKNDKKQKKLYQKLRESNNHYIFDTGESDENSDQNEDSIISNIINNLDHATAFIQQITSGNYEIDWQGLNEENKNLNQENLAGNLIKMRNQMKKAREEDKQRIWATQGHSNFAAITRRFQEDKDAMYDEFISELVQYLSVNQGALFVHRQDDLDQEEDKYLIMASCYAYNKKKYIDKKIVPGQGLVGQTFLEAETNYLTEIPQNYIQITSGLGDASPSALLIVPIKYNDQVEQSEELRMQEEEMRQNMEELEATQEEMRRQNQELETYISQLETEKKALLKEVGEISKIGGWEFDVRKDVLYWTEQTYKIHQIKPGIPITIDDAIEFYHPEDKPIIYNAFYDLINFGKTTSQPLALWE